MTMVTVHWWLQKVMVQYHGNQNLLRLILFSQHYISLFNIVQYNGRGWTSWFHFTRLLTSNGQYFGRNRQPSLSYRLPYIKSNSVPKWDSNLNSGRPQWSPQVPLTTRVRSSILFSQHYISIFNIVQHNGWGWTSWFHFTHLSTSNGQYFGRKHQPSLSYWLPHISNSVPKWDSNLNSGRPVISASALNHYGKELRSIHSQYRCIVNWNTEICHIESVTFCQYLDQSPD